MMRTKVKGMKRPNVNKLVRAEQYIKKAITLMESVYKEETYDTGRGYLEYYVDILEKFLYFEMGDITEYPDETAYGEAEPGFSTYVSQEQHRIQKPAKVSR